MDLDSEICVCFHVTLRKLWHYARREQPRVASQLTECLGAGTGCQSCVPLLEVIARRAPDGDLAALIAELEALEAARDARRRERLDKRNQEKMGGEGLEPPTSSL